ncbi:hypothetical protein A8F23_35570 [Burkholderia cenocepacia]|nr:hypothetical protein A8F23_35570 [Burkholderia cenocepacia]
MNDTPHADLETNPANPRRRQWLHGAGSPDSFQGLRAGCRSSECPACGFTDRARGRRGRRRTGPDAGDARNGPARAGFRTIRPRGPAANQRMLICKSAGARYRPAVEPGATVFTR